MPTRRRTYKTPMALSQPVASEPDPDWCWCGNRAVARCPDCHCSLCERHRLQEGQPPPDLVFRHAEEGTSPAWPYYAEAAWAATPIETGWLGRPLAEQLFLGAYADRADLALCQPCRARAGVALIDAWVATEAPSDGWDRAMWLMEQGFEPARVAASVDVGPPRVALRRFLDVARSSGVPAPDRLTLLWTLDRKGRTNRIRQAAGWVLANAAQSTSNGDGHHANLFVSEEGEAYSFGRDDDPKVGRVVTTTHGRTIEHLRQPDERFRTAPLVVLAFDLQSQPAAP
jgi:hypothetical protein